jgi:hypothetical protein
LPPYRHYGARGIEFRFADFASFIEVIGPRPSADYSLDRIDNDGHYEPGNVKWSTRHEQVHNRRPFTHSAYRKKTRKKKKPKRDRLRLKSLTDAEQRASRCFSGKQ